MRERGASAFFVDLLSNNFSVLLEKKTDEKSGKWNRKREEKY